MAAITAVRNVRKMLASGVTGFFDPDSIFDLGVDLKEAINHGVIEGPRMVVGGYALMTSVGGAAGRHVAMPPLGSGSPRPAAWRPCGSVWPSRRRPWPPGIRRSRWAANSCGTAGTTCRPPGSTSSSGSSGGVLTADS
jgi:hypothetical protein